MSTLIQIRQLSHALGNKTLFQGLNLTINQGDRIGLVGYNGCGKSTLLKLLSGSDEPDAGEIVHARDLQLETVEQFIPSSLKTLTLLDAAREKLATADDIPGGEEDYKAPRILQQLGFNQQEYDYLVKDLSGGQQNRLMFARAMINEPNFVLFDEPTNHLDLGTILYFEQYLRQMQAGFLLVSHDRDFLDAVSNRTIFLRDGQILSFDLPYSQAAIRLNAADQAAAATRKEEEKTIRQLRASAKRLALWGKVYDNEKLARKAKTMEKRIGRLEEKKTFVSRGSALSLNLDMGQTRANRILHIEDFGVFSLAGRQQTPLNQVPETLFHIENLTIRPGDRLALLGENGTGKTSLIQTIISSYNEDINGITDPAMAKVLLEKIKISPQCRIGYYDQELINLKPASTLLETLREHCGVTDAQIVSALIRAGFPYGDHDKKISMLSGGEKARIVFLTLQINQPNFLILDEPTNHIDIQGKEELETQLLESQATLLITSHDRRFINTIANRYVLIRNGQLHEIHHPDDFWSAQTFAQGEESRNGRHGSEGETPTLPSETVLSDDLNPDELLERLIELEEKLESDRQRRAKHQKPERQAEWMAEIRTINQHLDKL